MRSSTALFAFIVAAFSSLHAQSARPNIILVMADDLGWGQVGYYNHPDLKTPHIDEMAENSLRFDRFYAGAPVCSPTRASVLTGRSNDRTGAISHGYALRPQEKTIAAALAKAGYETAHFGKWHLDGLRGPGVPILEDDPHHPGVFGYEHWLAVTNFFDRDPLMSREGEFEDFKGDSSEVVVDEALRFIKERKNKDQPFFTTIWYGTPHSPFVSDDNDAAPFQEFETNKKNQYGEIIAMDRSIGTLRKGLRKLGLAENTILWFCSDNGGLKNMGPETVNGLRGFKGQIYEGGLRVPSLVEWPAVIKEANITSYPAATMDIFPTIASLLKLPKSSLLQPQDGASLAPLIKGKSPAKRKKPIPFRHIGRGAIVDNDYKLLTLDHSKDSYELYNLVEDPAESQNLINENPELAARLISVFEKWSSSVEDSIAAKDYPEGRLTSPEPEPIHWTETSFYQPYFEEWKKRPEYGAWLEKARIAREKKNKQK